jgi:hypothetical protein
MEKQSYWAGRRSGKNWKREPVVSNQVLPEANFMLFENPEPVSNCAALTAAKPG